MESEEGARKEKGEYYLEEEKQERENEQTTRERCNGEAMDG